MKSSPHKVLFLLFLFAQFYSCTKKGDGDPSISLRTRKNRVVGEWVAKSGSVVFDDGMGHASFGVSGTTYQLVNGPYKESGSATVSFSFDKKGNCRINIRMGTYAYIIEGTWNFTGGIGEKKKKEQIVIHCTSYFNGSSTYTYTGNFINITYDLLELRNKEMHIVSSNKESTASGFDSFSESWVLIPRK